jgi:hypothetical protein
MHQGQELSMAEIFHMDASALICSCALFMFCNMFRERFIILTRRRDLY